MNVLQPLSHTDVNRALVQAARAAIAQRLAESRPGHCLRVSTLPEPVMRDLCAQLNAPGAAEADVVLLLGPRQHAEARWQVTATRLVELRNAGARALLACVPPGLRAAAEDSFDVSTFVEIRLDDVPATLRRDLRARLPEDLRSLTDQALHLLRQLQHPFNDDDVVRYYLTLLHNDATREAAGGALYQLRLIPDFALLDIPDRIGQRLDRNLTALGTLTGSLQPLLGRILELKLRPNSLQPALYAFFQARPLDAVREWGRAIATDPACRPLALEQWPFEGEVADRDHVLLFVDELNLPARYKEQPIGVDNPLYLDVKRASSVTIKWKTDPKPLAVPDLAYFRIEIVGTDGTLTWESRNIPRSKSTKAERSRKLKTAEFREQVEDGLYFFRVRAYTESGDILNAEDPAQYPAVLRDPRNPEGKRQHESDDVWFWMTPPNSTDESPPADPLRNVTVHSFLEAQLLAQFAALERGEDPLSERLVPRADKTGWATAKGKRTEALYHIVYDAQARFTLPVSALLRQIESETLAHPETLGRWRLNFAEGESREAVTPTLRQFRHADRIPEAFLQARDALFQALRQGEMDTITATVDVLRHEALILAYADAYSAWLAQIEAHFETLAVREEGGRKRTDPLFLDLDTVEVDLAGERVYLLAPTHPLRLLWALQRARVARAWLGAAVQSGQPGDLLPEPVRLYLRQGPPPVNLPPFLRAAHDTYPEAISRFYVEQGPLTPFWSLYIRSDARDGWALRARVQRVLGIGRRSVDAAAVGGIGADVLTHKFLRYLVQHPYVTTLKINAFNPGDAGLVVDAILGVERQRAKEGLPELRYELRLFARAANLDDAGEAVDELLNPERQVSPEADAFTTPSQNHLYPKLRFSRNRIQDFRREPERYEAHVALLHDLFPVGVDLEPQGNGRSSFVYGLIQEQVTRFAGDGAYYAWQRQLLPTPCPEPGLSPLPAGESAEGLSARLATLLARIGALQAAVAAGRSAPGSAPTLHLALTDDDKSLLYRVHAVSDWVFIIDRHLGLEYFDSDAGDGRTVYLLDFTPEFAGADTDRLLLTTRAVDEVTRLIRPTLEEHGLQVGDNVEIYFLHLLRSLSGRLALKLLSSPSSVGEALGLALARLFLEQYDLLADRIVLPLDAHSALFAAAEQDTALDDEVAFRRGDLLLVTCDPATRALHFRIVEVKWRGDVGDLSAWIALRQQIEAQVTQSADVLRRHFDPHLRPLDRVDRQVKTKELISLLCFYLERSRRYGLVSDEAAATLRPFIESLDHGYTLTCSGAGLAFDLSAAGVTPDQEHAGLLFYRVGQDAIVRLLENGLRRRALLQEQAQVKPATIAESLHQQETRYEIVDKTSMRRDSTYPRVRTDFGANRRESEPVPSGSAGSAVGAPVVEPRGDRPSVPGPQPEPLLEPPSSDEAAPVLPLTPSPHPPLPPSPLPAYDVLLGDSGATPQYGILGKAAGKIVALDLSGVNTISLFGVQGAGKSYTVGSIVEMATRPFPGINALPAPLATVVFHYHESQDYPPEFVSMNEPNAREAEIRALVEEYGAQPGRLEDVLILTSADKVARRQAEFPKVRVEPLYFSSAELSLKDWRFLMGALGNQMYMKQIALIMRQLRERMTLATLRSEIEASDLSDNQKTIARIRLDFAAQFVDDCLRQTEGTRLADMLRPGRLVIVDLRDEFIDKDEALGLFVVMLNIFANAGRDGGGATAGDRPYNKLIVFDEAHKYMDNPDLTGHIVDVIRQMRHQGVSVLIASQDPPSLPSAIIELSSLVILHRFNSPGWLKHVQRSITSLADLTPAQMAALAPGEAYLWATKATERVFTQKAVKARLRPRVTRHGGETKKVGEGP